MARVEGALLAVEGVAQARVNLTTETARVVATSSELTVDRLIRAVRQAGYEAKAAPVEAAGAVSQPQIWRLRQQRRALIQAIGLALPVVGLEHLAPVWDFDGAGRYLWWRLFQGILCLVLLVSSAGRPILVGGWRALVHRRANRDLLVSLGVTVAFVASVISLLSPNAAAFHFDAAAMIVGFIVLGRYIETRARREASQAVEMLASEATGVGGASAIGRTLRAVEQAQTGRIHMQRIADRVSEVLVPVVLALALVTFAGWYIVAEPSGGQVDQPAGRLGWALRCAVAVLVIASPSAMGLAGPAALLVAAGAAALRGILVRDAAALEAAGRLNAVLLDKTGTLTTGRPEVKDIFDEPVGAITKEPREVLQWAASAEQFSQHPLARAIVTRAKECNLTLQEAGEFANHPGLGIQAAVDGRSVLVGSVSLMTNHQVDLSAIESRVEQMSADGQTVVLLSIDGVCAGLIGLADTVRPGASRAAERIDRLGLDLALVTGDQASTAAALAASVGVKDVHARMLPEEKLAEVRRRQEQGQRVAFVGDGFDDALALTAAEVGISFVTGTDVAPESADITLLGEDLTLIPEAIELARRSMRIIRQNLFWAFFYNLVAILLAAGGKIPPGIAAAVMMCSSIGVVLNSLRLRGRKS